jgi:hypothetical protein
MTGYKIASTDRYSLPVSYKGMTVRETISKHRRSDQVLEITIDVRLCKASSMLGLNTTRYHRGK